LDAQRTNDAYAQVADAVIQNDGTLVELKRSADKTLKRLRGEYEERAGHADNG
jgi:dephospho-CoA kinase